MVTPNTEACLVVLVLEAMAGLCSSVFIIISLILTSLKDRKVSSCNCILISLSISNVCFTITSSENLAMTFFWVELFNVQNVFLAVYSMFLCTITSSWGLTALLCFFYFIKICQFHSRFLTWVKMKIDTMVPWMILTLLLGSLLANYLSIFIFNPPSPNNSTNATVGLSLENQKMKENLMKLPQVLNTFSFIVSLLSTSGTARFLKSQRSAGTFGNSKVTEYQGAVHVMIGLTSYYAFIYLNFLLYRLEIFVFKSWGYWMSMMIGASFSVVQSGLIISRNPKLRDAWRQLFGGKFVLNQQDC